MQDKHNEEHQSAAHTSGEQTDGDRAELDARLRGHDGQAKLDAAAPDPESQYDIAELQAQLAGVNAALEKTQRQRLLDRALIQAGAIDLDDAHLLLERMTDAQGDAAEVVAELKRRKPHLFFPDRIAPKQAPTMSARRSLGRAPVLDAAYSAMSTGKRAELLQYMRMKRNGGRAAVV